MVGFNYLEILVVILLLFIVITLSFVHLISLDRLLLNKKVDREIVSLLLLSDKIMGELEVERLGVKASNVVDCSRLQCSEGIYVKCDVYVCGSKEDRMTIKRPVLYNGERILLEVGR